MKKVLRTAVKNYMYKKQKEEGRSVSTQEMVNYINDHYAFGTSVNEIINILGKDSDIIKAGEVDIRGRGKYGGYKGQAWTVALHWQPKKRTYYKTHRDLAERRESRRQILIDREMEPCNTQTE